MKSLEYIFISGETINLKCGLKIPQYKIQEIEESVGYSEYEGLVWSLTRNPYEFKFDFEDMEIDYNTITPYDMFLILNSGEPYADRYSNGWSLVDMLNFVFADSFVPEIEDGKIVFISINGRIDGSSISEIRDVFSKILFIEKPKERKPANEQAKELIKKQIKINAKKKVKYDIYSIMESLIWNKNSSETYETILKLTIRQIYSGYRNIEKINNFDNTINGLYSGVIDKEKINWESINWINKI